MSTVSNELNYLVIKSFSFWNLVNYRESPRRLWKLTVVADLPVGSNRLALESNSKLSGQEHSVPILSPHKTTLWEHYQIKTIGKLNMLDNCIK